MKNSGYIIRQEVANDYHEVENLTREAFWNVYRPGCMEHYLVHVLRSDKDFVPELSLVMEKDGEIIGHILYMQAKIHTDKNTVLPVMTFGPLSIAPEYQRQGYGKLLMDYSMEMAKKKGCSALCIEGNIDFYGKSGFVAAHTKGLLYYAEGEAAENPYLLVKELEAGFLENVTGVYYTPQGYYVEDEAVEAFDKQFPPKQKLKLPGQLFE